MDNKFLTSERSIYLDTSFILHSNYQCIDHKASTVSKSEKILWSFFMYKNEKCYISNIVLNEIYTVVERTALREYIDKKIIISENIKTEDWIDYNIHTRNQLRDKYKNIQWYNIRIKEWRNKSEYEKIYKIKVINEIQNILDSLPNFICISGFSKNEEVMDNFKNIKKKYKQLDWNDINHLLLCKEHNIDWIISCDSDFSWINENWLQIFNI